MNTCVICAEPTDSLVLGEIGGRVGPMCEDDQFWCDGNLIETP